MTSTIKLFCFPYAGGSSAIYSSWRPLLGKEIELVPVELAGRGNRMADRLYTDRDAMIDDMFRRITRDVGSQRYALFGHSMGAMISYDLSLRLRNFNFAPCEHLFVSGRRAPHVERIDEENFHLMDDVRFREEVVKLGGTPPDFFNYPELADVFLPLLRNDFRLTEAFNSYSEVSPLDCNITVFIGKDDDLTTEQCDGWKKHTKGVCNIHYFEGGHFFLHNEKLRIIRLIRNALLTDVYQ